MDLPVSETVPVGYELSSTAVMAVASILAFLAANNKLEGVTKRMLIDMQRTSTNIICDINICAVLDKEAYDPNHPRPMTNPMTSLHFRPKRRLRPHTPAVTLRC
jgi:hypothetical protein